MDRWGLFSSLSSCLTSSFSVISLVSNSSKTCPFHHAVDLLEVSIWHGYWSASGIFTFILCIPIENRGRVNLSKSLQDAEPNLFLLSIASQLGCIFDKSTKTHSHLCRLPVVHANSGALFNWEAIFAVRGFSER